jgi:hypothetical protein
MGRVTQYKPIFLFISICLQYMFWRFRGDGILLGQLAAGNQKYKGNRRFEDHLGPHHQGCGMIPEPTVRHIRSSKRRFLLYIRRGWICEKTLLYLFINLWIVYSFIHRGLIVQGGPLASLFGVSWSHTYRHKVGLLWTSDLSVADTSTYTRQHNTRGKHLWPERDSNPPP